MAAVGLAALGSLLSSARAARTELPVDRWAELEARHAEREAQLAALLAEERAREDSWTLPEEPATRMGYRHGRRRAIEVVPLGPDAIEVEVKTARAFLAMRAAAAEAGVELRLESGFRTREQQAELYRAWRKGHGNRAARPGRSNHQSGRALDIAVLTVPDALDWLEANAASFGFKRTVRSEPWHWEYVEAPRARGKSKRVANKRAKGGKHAKAGRTGAKARSNTGKARGSASKAKTKRAR